MTTPWLSDDEIASLCDGLVQPAAQVRYLDGVLHVKVRRKPNGRPLVLRTAVEGLDTPKTKRQAPQERQHIPGDAAGMVLAFNRRGR